MVDAVQGVAIGNEVIVLFDYAKLGQQLRDLRKRAEFVEVKKVRLMKQRHMRRSAFNEMLGDRVDQAGSRLQVHEDVRPPFGETVQPPLHDGATRSRGVVRDEANFDSLTQRDRFGRCDGTSFSTIFSTSFRP